jgi:D-tyrosyl-tRNA(Tyr) deacylase
MRALVQRVQESSVWVDAELIHRIGPGLLVLLGIGSEDTDQDALQLSERLSRLRIFADETGRMNRSVLDVDGEMLVVSQFTLYADTRAGNRPSFSQAAEPAKAKELYEAFVLKCRKTGVRVGTGIFQAHMKVHLINDGPVTLLCSSEHTARQSW